MDNKEKLNFLCNPTFNKFGLFPFSSLYPYGLGYRYSLFPFYYPFLFNGTGVRFMKFTGTGASIGIEEKGPSLDTELEKGPILSPLTPISPVSTESDNSLSLSNSTIEIIPNSIIQSKYMIAPLNQSIIFSLDEPEESHSENDWVIIKNNK